MDRIGSLPAGSRELALQLWLDGAFDIDTTAARRVDTTIITQTVSLRFLLFHSSFFLRRSLLQA